MPARLIEQLADRLSLTPPEAEQTLRAFVERLRERLHNGETVVLPTLGTFRLQDREITFEPAPALDLATNHRYAGLEPLPAAPPPDEPAEAPVAGDEPDVAPEASRETDDLEDGTWAPPRQETDDHPLGPPPPEPFEEADYAVVDEEGTAGTPAPETEDPFSLLKYGEQAHEEEEQEAVTEPAAGADEPGIEEEAEQEEEEREAIAPVLTGPEPPLQPAGDRDEPAAPPSQAPRAARRRPFPAGLLALALLGIAGGAVVAYLLLRSPAPSPSPPPLTEAPAPADTTTAAQPERPAPEADTTRRLPETPPPSPPAEPAPGREGLDLDAGGWTVVVASLTARRDAEAIAERYLDLNLPVDILTATTNNVTRYRVAVGQYPTQEAAQEAITRMGDRLPEGSWPLRIRPER
ncbi:SPOR domain-containing protein [Rhodocaloribacter litoris]|uniref:SPOR domain-containing protein n=1 Tax=Rhodocaloribacter litoris TaxID=2558931 RepID=UPI00141FD3EE|nr:SPOR domain-containing protein [Rhodocaloribacter litoris]QXD15363.1 SPOR domain-containing protein [Rhodocaloribacter litoris]